MTPGINHFPVASITWFASARTFPGTSPSNTAAILSDHMAFHGKLNFCWQPDEHIHGLGQGEEGIYDYRGNVQYLYQHNMRIPIPFLVSDRGYGILVDCGSLMTFNDDCRGSWLYLDMIEQLDYYFIRGENLDEIIKALVLSTVRGAERTSNRGPVGRRCERRNNTGTSHLRAA